MSNGNVLLAQEVEVLPSERLLVVVFVLGHLLDLYDAQAGRSVWDLA